LSDTTSPEPFQKAATTIQQAFNRLVDTTRKSGAILLFVCEEHKSPLGMIGYPRIEFRQPKKQMNMQVLQLAGECGSVSVPGTRDSKIGFTPQPLEKYKICISDCGFGNAPDICVGFRFLWLQFRSVTIRDLRIQCRADRCISAGANIDEQLFDPGSLDEECDARCTKKPMEFDKSRDPLAADV